MTGAISWFGDTDGSYIGYDYTGGDLGRFFISMVDDSNTEIHFRWNGNAAYVFQQTLMNAAGVTISAGNFSGAGTSLTGTAASLNAAQAKTLARSGDLEHPMTFYWSGRDGQPT